MPRRQVVESVQEVHVDHEFDSNVLRFRQALGRILGSDTHVHLAAIRLRPGRLAELAVGRPRYRPLRWSDLTEHQRVQLEDLLPYRGTDDLVMYGDSAVVVCPETEYQVEERRKALRAQRQLEQDLSPARAAQDAGVPIDTAWENIGAEHAPRPPDR